MIQDVPPGMLIDKVAGELKKMPEFQPPVWAAFVKTGAGRDRPPSSPDWWHARTASILRRIYLIGPIGVSKLSVKFGNRKNYGMAPAHFVPAATNNIRKILQQLEKAGFCKQVDKDGRKGRVLTPKGISFLDKAAAEVAKTLNIIIPKKPENLELPIERPKKAKAAKPKVNPVGEHNSQTGVHEGKVAAKPRAKRAPKKPATEAPKTETTDAAPSASPQ